MGSETTRTIPTAGGAEAPSGDGRGTSPLADDQCLEIARRSVIEQIGACPLADEVVRSLERTYLDRRRREAKIASLRRSLRSARSTALSYLSLLETKGLGSVPTGADGKPLLVDQLVEGQDGSLWVVRGYSPANGPYNVVVRSMRGPSPRPMREVRPEWMRHKESCVKG